MNAKLWPLADDAHEQVQTALLFALEAEEQPYRQKWLVAETDDRLVGIVHSMALPVPPIYAGTNGEPGLLLADSCVGEDAPAGTVAALVEAAELDLRDVGAQIMLASFVAGDDWRSCFAERGYEPLTLYLSRVDLRDRVAAGSARTASEDDLPGIVARSAENRTILFELDRFWLPHHEADARFRVHMKKSLSMADRDMLVLGAPDALDGYVIAQPASRLHFPPAHDITAIGVIDDYFHREFSNPTRMRDGGVAATLLLRSAEAAFVDRGRDAVLVVCPAAWTSKRAILEDAGYETAMVWMIKR